jgi:hypothetical protein
MARPCPRTPRWNWRARRAARRRGCAQLRVERPGDAVVVDEAAGAVDLAAAAAASPRQHAGQAPERPRVVQHELAPAGLVHHLHAKTEFTLSAAAACGAG